MHLTGQLLRLHTVNQYCLHQRQLLLNCADNEETFQALRLQLPPSRLFSHPSARKYELNLCTSGMVPAHFMLSLR